MEQTGILSFGDRAVAFASFSNEGDDVGLITKDILRATESQAVHGSVIENSKNIAQEASQLGARTDQEAPGARSRPIYPMLAIFSGAILAGFGLVSSRGRKRDAQISCARGLTAPAAATAKAAYSLSWRFRRRLNSREYMHAARVVGGGKSQSLGHHSRRA
jgi:hypothetical protein